MSGMDPRMDPQLSGFVELALPQAARTQRQTADYLRREPELSASIGAAYACYQTLLVFPTGLRFGRPYYPYNLPFYEAAGELETSLLLAFSGEYKGALQHLRFVLELALLGLHFCEPAPEDEVKRWLLGGRTPWMGDMLKGLRGSRRVATLGTSLGEEPTKRYYDVYEALSGYVHTRGQAATGSHMRGSNFPLLSTLALRNWAGLLSDAVRAIAVLALARFPQALQGVPLFEKFGFDRTPRSGFLEPFEVPRLEAPFEPAVAAKLKRFSDAHHAEEYRFHWDRIRAAPDLTLPQLRASADRWWEIMQQADQGYIPGRTWRASWATPETMDRGARGGEPQTRQEFLEVVTHARRQLNVSDETMLAHAYAQNLSGDQGARGAAESNGDGAQEA